jgi:hypothetical protein
VAYGGLAGGVGGGGAEELTWGVVEGGGARGPVLKIVAGRGPVLDMVVYGGDWWCLVDGVGVVSLVCVWGLDSQLQRCVGCWLKKGEHICRPLGNDVWGATLAV